MSALIAAAGAVGDVSDCWSATVSSSPCASTSVPNKRTVHVPCSGEAIVKDSFVRPCVCDTPGPVELLSYTTPDGETSDMSTVDPGHDEVNVALNKPPATAMSF